jgi:hypothetical protein
MKVRPSLLQLRHLVKDPSLSVPIVRKDDSGKADSGMGTLLSGLQVPEKGVLERGVTASPSLSLVLPKIINSLASRRPASEASLLALGIRPSTLETAPNHAHESDVSGISSSAATPFLGPRATEPMSDADMTLDLSRLPDGTDLPGDAGLSMSNGAARNRDSQRDESFKAHRAVFFFKLGRELEKVSSTPGERLIG